MKKIISLLLVSTTVLSLFALSACSSLNIQEQPDAVIIYADKIYPSAIGDYLKDTSVNVPAIEAYMKEYNKNADESAVINYDTIKYNKDSDYYYVNDKETDLGIKFRLDSTMAITNAYIYTGTLDQTQKNVYNIVINAIETSGYKTLMTDEDKAIIQHTLQGFNGVSASKNEVMQIFNGQENFAAKWENNIAEFEIPLQPEKLPEPDKSHTLAEIVMPTIEIPSISLDTTIVEGTHLSDGTPVSKEKVESIASQITGATADIRSVTEYTKTSPDEINSVIDDIAVQSKINDVTKSLFDVDAYLDKLTESQETKNLSTTKDLANSLNDSYAEYEKMTKPTVGFTGANGVKNNANKYFDAIFDSSDLSVNGSDLFDKNGGLDNVKKTINNAIGTDNIGKIQYKEPDMVTFDEDLSEKKGYVTQDGDDFIKKQMSNLSKFAQGLSDAAGEPKGFGRDSQY